MPRAGDGELDALVAYYRSPAVRARMAEYCGGRADDPQGFTAVSLAGYGGRRDLRHPEGAPVTLPLAAWPRLLDDGADVCRSLADRTGTLLMFDVDYVNQHDPAEPYRDPARTFARLEPIYEATLAALSAHGVRPLTLMTGRGYHMVVKARGGSALAAALCAIGAPDRPTRPSPAARAHDGAGRLLEFLAHEVMRAVAGYTEVPVSVIDMPPAGGGPFICLDVTAYGDPLAVRNGRCAFSGNQKARAQGLAVRPGLVAVLPRSTQALDELLRVRADLGLAAEWARTAAVAIPTVEAAPGWLEAYRDSALGRFHRSFDEEGAAADARAPESLDLETLPACAAYPLTLPNAALLTPGWLRSVALTLWAQGWHPRAVVDLVMSRYDRDHGWGDYWERYDRRARASFYVRVCCGAVAAEVEDWKGFTCDSQRGRGFCPGPRAGCGADLARLGPPSRRPS
jgi:hypothetical protein